MIIHKLAKRWICLILALLLLHAGCNEKGTSSIPALVIKPSSEIVTLTPIKTRLAIDTAITPEPPQRLTTNTPKTAELITITPALASLDKAVGIIHADYDPTGKKASDFIIDENGNILSSFIGTGNYSMVGEDPCHFYSVRELYKKGIALMKWDLQGNQVDTKVIPIPSSMQHPFHIFGVSLSPDGQWISYYWTSEGEEHYDPRDAENRNLELLHVSESTTPPISVTSHGRSTKQGGRWSPDSHWLAYSDRDEQGNFQIYLFDPMTKEKKQISQFDLANIAAIDEIRFSPDGEKIAFLAVKPTKTNNDNPSVKIADGVVGIIHLNKKKIDYFSYSDQTRAGDTIYWSSDSTQFVTVIGRMGGDHLVWFDAYSMEIVFAFPELETTGIIVSNIFPLGNTNKLFIYGENIVYDRVSSSVKKVVFPDLCCSNSNYLAFQEKVDLRYCERK
jgi:hypothetical protein